MVSRLLFFSNVVFVWAAYNQAHTFLFKLRFCKRLHACAKKGYQDCFPLGNHGNPLLTKTTFLLPLCYCLMLLPEVPAGQRGKSIRQRASVTIMRYLPWVNMHTKEKITTRIFCSYPLKGKSKK